MRLTSIFMGTPDFAVPSLAALAQATDVLAVYCQPDRAKGRGMELQAPAVKLKALELGLAVRQPERASAPDEIDFLRSLNPDVIVVVAYGQILKRAVLELPRLGCINVHASLLPRWRGAAPINWAILAGDRETGVCTQVMVEKLDAGPVLLSRKTLIQPSDTAPTLYERLSRLGAELVAPTLEGLASQSVKPQPQDESQITYASKLSKEMERLDPYAQDAEELERRIRGLQPWPGTSVWVGGGSAFGSKTRPSWGGSVRAPA